MPIKSRIKEHQIISSGMKYMFLKSNRKDQSLAFENLILSSKTQVIEIEYIVKNDSIYKLINN